MKLWFWACGCLDCAGKTWLGFKIKSDAESAARKHSDNRHGGILNYLIYQDVHRKIDLKPWKICAHNESLGEGKT